MSFTKTRITSSNRGISAQGCGCGSDNCHRRKLVCDKVVVIDGCHIVSTTHKITESGVYKLCGNIHWNGGVDSYPLSIEADDVVLDLNGYNIIDQSTVAARNTVGIVVECLKSNVSIINGSVIGFGASAIYVKHGIQGFRVNKVNVANIGAENGQDPGVGWNIPYGGVSTASTATTGITVAGNFVNNFVDEEPETADISITECEFYNIQNTKVYPPLAPWWSQLSNHHFICLHHWCR